MALINPGFEDGLNGWTQQSWDGLPFPNMSFSTENGYVASGSQSLDCATPSTARYAVLLLNNWRPLIAPESNVTATCKVRGRGGQKGGQFFEMRLFFYDSAGNTVHVAATPSDRYANANIRDAFVTASISARAPAGAVYAQLGLVPLVNTHNNRHIYIDSCEMNVTEIDAEAIFIVFPVNGSKYQVGDTVPLRVTIKAGTPVTGLKYVITNTSTAASQEVVATGPSYGADISTLGEGSYSVVAVSTLSNATTLTTSAKHFTVGAADAVPTTEFKASNSYANLVLQDFHNLAANMPATAIVTGAQLEVNYKLQLLIRSKDKEVPANTARYEAMFNVAPSMVIAARAMIPSGNGQAYVGSPATLQIPLKMSDFSVVEDGTSEGKRWTVLENAVEEVTIGSEDNVFGLQNLQAGEFLDYSVAMRAYPQLGAKPEWADSGDACIRTMFDSIKLKVFFDGGSVEYYFVDPLGGRELKGILAAVYVDGGNLRRGDATGIMQLLPEFYDGDSPLGYDGYVYAGYNIHSAVPPTDKNKIGVVSTDMEYNGLPTYNEVLEQNRARYLFISANFYGSPELNSIYGVNGSDRAFAYNGEYFYKVTTHPDEELDTPRHVAYHHSHLALGYGSGRVDLSVVGEPWNYEGVDGASSWAIGDEVTGLLPLSGTMLGIFGRKSITGLSGTTVDNFSTQIISPKMGAVEYTVADMGFPVYANTYGVYTLSQTAEYGDYLGTPMSQAISPWLRPRLVRSPSSDKEVVVAWPVRSKNQYKLAFSDGYVLTMTMNYGNQGAPTFSKQMYTTNDNAIIPAAISSELDETGEERIHVANKTITSEVIIELGAGDGS